MPRASMWEGLRVNFTFVAAHIDEPRIECVNCSDSAECTNLDQIVKWARRHLDKCSGLVPISDANEIGFSDGHAEWYEAREILTDED